MVTDKRAIHLLAVNTKRHMKDRRLPLTQQALSKASGVSQATISGILNERSDPSVCSLLRIADALDITLDALFKEEKSRIPELVY